MGIYRDAEVNVDVHVKGKGKVTGRVYAAVTDANHAYLHTDAMNVQGNHLAYRGKEFYATLHVYRQDDGSWQPEKPGGYWGCSEVNSFKEATRSQRETIRAALMDAWQDFISGSDHLLVSAAKAKLERDIETAQGKVEETHKAFLEAVEELNRLVKLQDAQTQA